MKLKVITDGHELIFQFLYEHHYSEQYNNYCWIDQDGEFQARYGIYFDEEGI